MKRNLKNHPDLPKDFSLESLRNQNPFRVPDGYFDELPILISERIDVNPVIKKTRRLHPGVFAAAASVIILLGLALVMRTSIYTTTSTSTQEMQLSEIPDTHIVNHFDNKILNGEIDEPALIDAVVNASSQETATTSKSAATTLKSQAQTESTEILPNVSDEEIIEYLVQNQTPTTTTNDIVQ